MKSPLKESIFPINLWATPPEWAQELFWCPVRAGHLVGGVDHHIERETYPGHEFIYCLAGQGWVRIGGQKHRVSPGELLWVNCHHPHAYGSVKSEPWEVLWVRSEGRELEKLASLLRVERHPVLKVRHRDLVETSFRRIFDAMVSGKPGEAAGAQAALWEIVAQCFQNRLLHPDGIQTGLSEAVREAIIHMRNHFATPLRVNDLAKLVGMPASSFTRHFRQSTGTSPITWLRHERIKQAKRRLVESDDPIKEVARQVGYADQYFFSKDFKKMTKLTPSQFRQGEGGLKYDDRKA